MTGAKIIFAVLFLKSSLSTAPSWFRNVKASIFTRGSIGASNNGGFLHHSLRVRAFRQKACVDSGIDLGMTSLQSFISHHRLGETCDGHEGPGENVWVHVDVLIANDVCGSGALESFKRGFGENAQMIEKMTLYNMVTEVGGNNEVVSVDKFTVKLLEDKTYLGYAPVYIDKDVRFIQNYSFDVSKLNVMVAKSLSPDYRFDVSKLNTMAAQPLSPDYHDLASECKDAKIKRVRIASLNGRMTEDSRGLAKYFIATVWVSATNRNFPGRMWHKEVQIYFVSLFIAAASAMIGLVTDLRAKRRVGKMILFCLRGTYGYFCSFFTISPWLYLLFLVAFPSYC